jgi:NYN domain
LVVARTFVYVDGFNLYHRALKGTPYKWLNLMLLAGQVLATHNQIECIKYFTARVSGHRDKTSPARQAAYLKAIGTLPAVQIFYGHFLAKTITRPLVHPIRGLPKYVEVHTSEEKGSDVNLAVNLVNDAWAGRFDVAAVISNDSDLEAPIRIVKTELLRPVGLLCPHDGTPSPQLKNAATFVRHIRQPHLAASQFPGTILGADGKLITKPPSW